MSTRATLYVTDHLKLLSPNPIPAFSFTIWFFLSHPLPSSACLHKDLGAASHVNDCSATKILKWLNIQDAGT